MDFLTFVLLFVIFFVMGCYHREQQRQGHSGIPIFGPVFVDTVCSWFEGSGEVTFDQWLDQKFKEHEEKLRQEILSKKKKTDEEVSFRDKMSSFRQFVNSASKSMPHKH